MNPPKYLYKYEAFTVQSLLNLRSQIIYFGSPLKFNDPYDCALVPNLIALTNSEIEQLREWYLSNPNLPSQTRTEFKSSSMEKLRINFTNGAHSGFRDAINDFLKNRGVACFSEENDDLLMWSHYGGHYKGFCLEFDTTSEPFQKIYPVKYVSKIPAVKIESAIKGDYKVIEELFCTKSTAWAYEKEWRAIHKAAGTSFGYSQTTLTGIYFGPDIEWQSMEIICLILMGQNENVKFWHGSRSATEFKVLFEQKDYTSHLEAKRRRLIE